MYFVVWCDSRNDRQFEFLAMVSNGRFLLVVLLFLVVEHVTSAEIITTSRYRLKNLIKEGNNLYLLLFVS